MPSGESSPQISPSEAMNVTTCKHPIWRYLGVHHWGDYDADGVAIREQRHMCIDCGNQERDVPDGCVMIGHAPGECCSCDKNAALLAPEVQRRWIELTERGRS